jgi:aminoglycoside phosphotransferase (APT) family kinase protein
VNSAATKESLERFINRQKDFEEARVENLRKMPGGASKETWSFDLFGSLEGNKEVIPMVLRIERASPLPVSIDLKTEFYLLREVHAWEIPVPRPYWVGQEDLGNPFSILERIEGETLVRRLQRDDLYQKARRAIPGQLGRALARIHRIPLRKQAFDFLPWRSRHSSPALSELGFYETLLEKFSPDPHPALELAIRWLKAHLPSPREQVLVHGDYRLGNIVYNEAGVRSILDWELAHIGDPLEDVGYISVQAWRFGQEAKPIGGIGEREDFYKAYQEADGFPFDPESLYYWEVFGNLKWGIITILQAIPFIQGDSSSIELASLGRKTAEVELQLLTLIEEN